MLLQRLISFLNIEDAYIICFRKLEEASAPSA